MTKPDFPHRFLLFLLLVPLVLLASCAAPPAGRGTQDTPTSIAAAATGQAVVRIGEKQTAAIQPGEGSTREPALSQPPAATSAPTRLPPSPTPDNRLPPEQWQDWPVVPTATGRAIDIYRLGQALGNDPKSFSKVGDCQSIKEVLMGIYDRGAYRLDPGSEYLQETIDNFSGSFDRDGMAVQGGFSAASVLSPLWANPDTCQPGETPLDCELRVHKPSFVIISLEVWWNGRTPERYEQYMRRIIETAIAKGVVPVLATKADNVEGNQSINLTTAKLAYEYDLPLWNWWRAAQDLPNRGLDPSRPDSYHLSLEAWTPRAHTALEALDSVWRGVRGQPARQPVAVTPLAPLATVPPPPIATSNPTATFIAPTPAQNPIGGSGRVIFGLNRRTDQGLEALGVYHLDLQTGQKTQVAGKGTNFQSISPDGKRILFNQGSDLYLARADGTQPLKLSSNFFPAARLGAVWLPDGQRVAFIAQEGGQRFVALYPLDGSGWRRLTGAADQPVELFPSNAPGSIYWGSGACSVGEDCSVERAAFTNLQGASTSLEGITRPLLSPDGKVLAYSQSKNEDQSVLVLAKADGSQPREAILPGDNVLDYSWSPEGKRLAVLLLNRSDYSGRWGSINTYIFVPANFGNQALPKTSGLNARALWSPDGKYLLMSSTEPDGQGYRVSLRLLNTASQRSIDYTAPLGLNGPDLLLTTNMAWFPAKP